MKITHVVVTDAFAGTERYVVDVSSRLAQRGHEVTVIGGARLGELVDPSVRVLRGESMPLALASAARLRKQDIVHAHLTFGELVAVSSRAMHGGRCLATRHIAAVRGATRAGRLARPWIERGLSQELAISEFVASAIDRPSLVVLNGVQSQPAAERSAKALLVAQRLEPEKNTVLALTAWFASDLPNHGWSLLFAGTGSEMEALMDVAARHELRSTVKFLGHVSDMATLYADVGAVLATARAEPLGLTVLEAMARGLPVIAAASGGHLETVVRGDCLFAPADGDEAALRLNQLLDRDWAVGVGDALRMRQRSVFDIDRHVDRLEQIYSV